MGGGTFAPSEYRLWGEKGGSWGRRRLHECRSTAVFDGQRLIKRLQERMVWQTDRGRGIKHSGDIWRSTEFSSREGLKIETMSPVFDLFRKALVALRGRYFFLLTVCRCLSLIKSVLYFFIKIETPGCFIFEGLHLTKTSILL